jgi:hypothetical protein
LHKNDILKWEELRGGAKGKVGGAKGEGGGAIRGGGEQRSSVILIHYQILKKFNAQDVYL